MMWQITAGEKSLAFDDATHSVHFRDGDWTHVVKLEAVLSYSREEQPWRLRPGNLHRCDGAVRAPELQIAAEFDDFTADLAFRFDKNGRLRGSVRWKAAVPLSSAIFAFALPFPAVEHPTLPMSLYNGNPSTGAPDAPHFRTDCADCLLLEETRLPVPGGNVEFDGHFFSLLLEPSEADEWSLGLERRSGGETALLFTSGAVAVNGRKDHIYGLKCRLVPFSSCYRELRPDDTLRKNFAIHWGTLESPGHGFRDLPQSAFKLFSPQAEPVLSRTAMIALKRSALDERSMPDGYICVPPGNIYRAPVYYLYGWTGQSFRLAFCDIKYGVLFDAPEYIDRARRRLDFFLAYSGTGLPGLRHTYYRLQEERWEAEPEGFSVRALGETYSDLGRILVFAREHRLPMPDHYLECLCEGMDFMLSHLLPCGIPPVMWRPDGSAAAEEISAAGTAYLTGLWHCWSLTDDPKYRSAAEWLLRNYWMIGGDRFDRPFSHATLDSGCEDKEAGIPFFTAAALAWRLTGETEYRHWAEVTADWLLSWMYCWNVPFAPESFCRRNGFKSLGWSTVSVENQHLDVFFPAWELFEFGLETGNDYLQQAGSIAFAAWSHGISQGGGDWMFQTPGHQGEQFFQTNWTFPLCEAIAHYPEPFRSYFKQAGFRFDGDDRQLWRGGYNPWDVSWIIALVFDAALSFEWHGRRTGGNGIRG